MCARAPSGLRTFLELRLGELRRIPLLSTWVNNARERAEAANSPDPLHLSQEALLVSAAPLFF